MSKEATTIEFLARGVLIVDGHLLACHGKGKPISYLPGGHIEKGEVARQALERELMEEAGLAVRAGRFLGAVEHQFVQKGRAISEINLIFEMTVGGLRPPTPPPSLEDYIEFEWVSLKELAESRLEPAHVRLVLPGWLSNKSGPERHVDGGEAPSRAGR